MKERFKSLFEKAGTNRQDYSPHSGKVRFILGVLALALVFACSNTSSSSSGSSESELLDKQPYAIVEIPGLKLPADPDNWTPAEKSLWVYQTTQIMDNLTSTPFRGRLSGDIGYDRATYWAAATFRAWGVEPLEGSYFQPFTL
ncbi:MAG: hypothetical protein LBH73_03085, partial [Spirochaetaceae bacterium]|nr:hypothetical protein [Spirochaetaceae bacterium]